MRIGDKIGTATIAGGPGLERPAPEGFTLKKPSKYRNRKTEIDGYVFDSKGEARRYLDLRAEQSDGTIKGLRRQVEFPLKVNGILIAVYVADFVYIRDGKEIVEDFKGYRKREYIIKRSLMKAIHGIEILETK